MTASLRIRSASAVFALLTPLALAAPASEKQKFTLGQYIPQDCWLYVHGVHNPERDFVDAHWQRVFAALKNSGITNDIKDLVFSGAPAEDRAKVEEGWTTAMKLLDGVRWGDLTAKEFAFAERLTEFVPDIILLFRSAPGSVESNAAGLKAILDQMATLSGALKVSELSVEGVKGWRLAAADVPLAFHVIHKDDVVGMVLGDKAVREIAAMLSGKQAEGSLVQNERFKKALADLPPAEDEIGFFDLKMLMSNIDGIMAMAFKKSQAAPKDHAESGDKGSAEKEGEGKADGEKPGDPAAPADTPAASGDEAGIKMLAKVVNHFDFIDYVLFTTHTEGLQQHTASHVRLQRECKQKSLCKMFTGQKPFERFDKYIPKEATGFALWDGLQLKELYQAILDFIKEETPGGKETLAHWAQVQQEMGFDVEADFFSWWSGELISVSLPAAVRTPFAGSDSVLMVRVKDPKLAGAKINAAIDRIAALCKEHNQPLLMQDVKEVKAEGFRSVTHPMFAMLGRLVIGVADDHLILASSPQSINQCLETAAGKAPSILQSERFKAEGIAPKGPVCSATFTDLSNMGQEMAAAFFSIGFVSAFIPDEPETKGIKAVFGMLSKLSPAIQEINFFSSSSSVSEFDGEVWRTKQVLTYKKAEPPTTDVAQKP